MFSSMQKEKKDNNMFTVDGKSYYITFNKAVDAEEKGELVKHINESILRKGNLYESGVFVTSSQEVYNKIMYIVQMYDRLYDEEYEGISVSGEYADFIVKSNAESIDNLHVLATCVESALYETENNIRCAENKVMGLYSADFVMIVPAQNCVNTYIVYLIFDE